MKEYGSCPAFGYQCEYVAKVEAQAAEIEKLEANIETKAHFIEAILGHMDLQYAAGAAEECAKIVAWLLADGWSARLDYVANAIEAKEHLK